MKLSFKAGSEVAILDINRDNKNLIVTSSKTNYTPTTAKWNMLFDPGKEVFQEEQTDKLNDAEFQAVVIAGMAQQGYSLTKAE